MKAQALQMLIPEGNPNGMKIIELSGWSGKCFVIPRQSLKELKNRTEINQPGLYLLFGLNEESGDELVYIGESENFYNRITNHDSNKDFWNVAVIFTGGLNRAFVKYLEYKATTLAHEAKRMVMENKVQPQENSLSEFEKIAADQYFENTQFILGALNYSVFESIADSVSDTRFYYLKSDGADARAQLLKDASLNVLKGSLVRIRETGSFGDAAVLVRKFLLDDMTLIDAGDGISYVFTKDHLFRSPSAASDAITGRSTNGWKTWKDENGVTLDENLRK